LRYVSRPWIHSCTCIYHIFATLFDERAAFSPVYIFGSIVKNQKPVFISRSSIFHSIDLGVCFMPVLCHFVTITVWYNLRSDIMISPALHYFAQDWPGCSMFFVLQYEFQDCISSSMKNAIRILVRITLNLLYFR
jgi:hypothetical protein